MQRIVSFLPSATELVYELGLGDTLFGVTHECEFPEDAKRKPRVIDTIIDSKNLSSGEIDKTTCKLLNEGKDIFILNEKNLRDAKPDVIISQETCEVCAAHTNQVSRAVQILHKKPSVYSMDPHNMKEILTTVIEIGKVLGKEKKAKEIHEKLRDRITNISTNLPERKPKVLAIEWLDPFFTAGHWVPEMIDLAGGVNLLSQKGEHSRRMTIYEIQKADPEIIILMPCGFDVKRTAKEYNELLKKNQNWSNLQAVKNGKIFAVDANSYFSKPSIRTITGLEILAKIIHKESFENLKIPKNSFVKF
ncbi:MAG: cobalamin-binding protein [Nitrosopumilaceae archaeon]|nr:cobalamin-binding protein [Nitrosopumilaceae archaeon]